MRSLISLLVFVLMAFPAFAKRVQFAGMQELSRSDLRLILGDRLESIEAKPPSLSRAADAAFVLERLLQLQGYAQAKVEGRVAQDRILLVIEEGARQYFGHIAIDGLEGKDRKISKQLFLSNAKKRLLLQTKRVPFLEEDVTEGMKAIIQEWQSRGYWQVKIDPPIRRPREKGDVDFRLVIDRGEKHLLGRVEAQGLLYREDFMRRILLRYEGLPATTANINEIRRKVIAFYRKRGYTDALVTLTGEPREGKFHTQVKVELGQRYRLRRWQVLGLEKTLPDRVTARLAGTEGEFYDANRADRTVRELLNTGAFSSIQLESQQVPGSELIDATLHLREGEARALGGYGGVETFEGAIVGASYADRNLLGLLLQLQAGLEWSQRGVLFDTRVTDPFFLDTDIRAGYRYFAVNRDLDVYQKFESGVSVDFTWPINTTDTLLLFFATSYVNISNETVTPSSLGATKYNHNRSRLTWTRERRNSAVNPTSGWFWQAAAELGAVIGTLSTPYVAAEGQLSHYIPVDEIHHLGLSLRGGAITSPTGVTLPIDLRYFLGGPSTVRSFPQRELGPRDSQGQPFGGEAWWVANSEYVHQVTGPLKAVAFVDVGTLSEKAANLGLSSIDVAIGLGARLDLPIGPVRVEYGHNLTQDPGEPSGALFFAIGIVF